jgi:hypothetical protein
VRNAAIERSRLRTPLLFWSKAVLDDYQAVVTIARYGPANPSPFDQAGLRHRMATWDELVV